MAVHALLLLLVAAAPSAAPAPPTAVVLTRRVDIPRLVAQEVVGAVAEAVAAKGIAVSEADSVAAQKVRTAAEACGGKPLCVREAGRKLGVEVVVGVQVGALGSTVAVYVEALRVSDGEKLAEHNTPTPSDKLRSLPGIEKFARRLKEALGPTPAPAPASVAEPAKAEMTPVVVQPPVVPPPPDPAKVPAEAVAARSAEPAPSHTAGATMVGIAAAAAVGAIVCLASGLALGEPLKKDASGHIDLPYREAESRRGTVNALFVTGAAAGGAALLAGGTAILVW